ncbi:unnamed protein product [Lepidochelys olivacea]
MLGELPGSCQDVPLRINRKEVLQFLGFTGYYKRYIKGYSKLAAPIFRLTAGEAQTRRRNQRGPTKIPSTVWTDECDQAFTELKTKLTTALILGYANYSLPFILQTDSSTEGLGAVLAQIQSGKERVIVYASRGLTPSEKKILTINWSSWH